MGVDVKSAATNEKVNSLAITVRFPRWLTIEFSGAPLAARRPASRCSVAHSFEERRFQWLVSAKRGHSHTMIAALSHHDSLGFRRP